MKFGAEPKKVGILVALVAVAGIVYWMNSSPEAPPAPSTPRAAAQTAAEPAPSAAATAGVETPGTPARKRQPQGRASIIENVYKLVPVSDPGKVDPTLRMDLLAKVQSVDPEGGARNLFQFSKEPPPPPAPVSKTLPTVPNLHPNGPTPVSMASTPRPPQPAGPPPVSPINLKYYGYSINNADGEKKAFFLDGDDIIVAAEGDIIKKQYKIVRITSGSVQMEDATSKTTQTLPIQQEAAPV